MNRTTLAVPREPGILGPARVLVAFGAVVLAAGTGGLLALLLHRALAGAPAVPLGDPFLAESLHHHG